MLKSKIKAESIPQNQDGEAVVVKTNKKTTMRGKKRNEIIFLSLMMAFPLLQFCIFYIGVNFNSIMLAFKSYNYDSAKYYFDGFTQFERVFKAIFTQNGELTLAVKNSTIQFLAGLLIGMPLQIMVAYVMFKKVPCSGFYKVMLFMPNMISSIVFVMCARVLFQEAIPSLLHVGNLLDTLNSKSFYTVLIFGLWMSFAGGLIIYLSAMSSIPKDILEYGSLENMNSFQEFCYIVVPSIFPTITTYLVVAIAGFFTNYGHFYSFFKGDKLGTPYDTLGYYFFVKVAGGANTVELDLGEYCFAAAGGVLFTVVVAPITLITKWLLEKYGPSED